MSATQFESPINRLLFWAQKKPSEVYLSQPIKEQTIEYTWSQALNEVSRVAHYLARYPRGSHIAIISLNCAHWILADLAIQMAGHISIPIYPTASQETIEKVLKHSEASAVFLGKMFDIEKAPTLLTDEVDKLALYQPYPGMPFWSDLVNDNEPMSKPVTNHENDLVSIIYTSGTTGDPKGVMVSYRAICESMNLIKSIIIINEQDRFVSYLPLAHVAERMAVEFGALYHGAHVSFIRSLETFTADIKKAHPTIFFGVPRIWTKIKLAIETKLGGPKTLNFLFNVPLFGHWLKGALLKKLGFQDVRFALCAAAAVNKDVLKWFDCLGLKLNEAYGMSETCGLSHMVKQQQNCMGSVGQVIEGCECQLSTTGEVMLRNPAMMDGYYKQPELTAETINSDGWLHTGDLGVIDAAGFLYITGRVKDIFKTSKGKYISPTSIEQQFQSLLGIEQLILMGDGFSQPFLVVSVFESSFTNRAQELIEVCQHTLNDINPRLEPHERVSHVFISEELWSPDNGLLTPTLKMKRNALESFYQSKADDLMSASTERVMVLK